MEFSIVELISTLIIVKENEATILVGRNTNSMVSLITFSICDHYFYMITKSETLI